MTKKEKEILFKKEKDAYDDFKFRVKHYGTKDESTIRSRWEWNSLFELINDLGLYEESYEWRLKNVKNN